MTIHRRAWVTIVLSVLLGPAIGMFYLGKGRNGLAYVGFQFLVVLAAPVIVHLEVTNLGVGRIIEFLHVALLVVGVPHCYLVFRRMHGNARSVWFGRWYGLAGIPLAPVLVSFLVRALIFEPFSIPSESMLPTLQVGDHLFVSKYSYGLPRRGDVAVFKLPRDNSTKFIQRVVGLPGDRVQLREGVLYINDQEVGRKRVEDFVIENSRGNVRAVPQFVETMPNGRRYRTLDLFPSGAADNTEVFTVQAGHFFMMGDNRDNSLDSRFAQGVGQVPAANFVGRMELVFWNGRDRKIKLHRRD